MEQNARFDFEEMRRKMLCALQTLPPLERDVLTMRFGLDGKRCRTIQDVGERFGMTRLQVRTVEAKALRRIRRLPEQPARAEG